MYRSVAVKSCISLLVALLAVSPPAFATCTQCCRVCGPLCPQVIYDNYLDEGCWDLGGSASIVNISGDNMAELSSVGSVSQEIDAIRSLQFDVTAVAGSDPGTERIAVEIVSTGGTLLDTLDTVNSSGTYQLLDIPDYGVSRFRLRFRMLVMPDPGDTVYRIDNVMGWTI